jgi:hypothetical protein
MSRTTNTAVPLGMMDRLESLVASYVAENKKGNEELRSSVNDFVNHAKITIDKISKQTSTLTKFIAAEGTIIEEDLNQEMRRFLRYDKRFSNVYVYRPKKWKYLNKPEISFDKAGKENKYRNYDEITEFDGLFVVSSVALDISTDFVEPIRIPRRATDSRNARNAQLYFVVLEAKHGIGRPEFNHKYSKMKLFQEYILSARDQAFVEKGTLEFQEKVAVFGLPKFQTHIEFFIGAKSIASTLANHIQGKAKSWLETDDIAVSYFLPGGTGYVLYDMHTNFEPNNMLYGDVKANSVTGSRISIGSGKRKNI